jgi:aspartate carbamoyltransferase catalytic subunit
MQHLINVDDLDHNFIFEIIDRAKLIKRLRHGDEINRFWSDLSNLLTNRLMITMFFQPSTRTRLSFEAAMSYLGGKVIGTENADEFSSFKKGASIEDEFRVIGGYCDIIVGRFKNEGDALRAASTCAVPIINGGDGKGEHPTQALLDLFTIVEKFPNPEKLTVSFVGDNRRSRTVHSLARLLSGFQNVGRLYFMSCPDLTPAPHFMDELDTRAGRPIANLYPYLDDNLIQQSDVVYVTRSQDEHGGPVEGALVFGPNYAAMMKPNAIILHPLPRNSELPAEVDSDPRAYYFDQAHNGLYVRMALLEAMCPRNRF